MLSAPWRLGLIGTTTIDLAINIGFFGLTAREGQMNGNRAMLACSAVLLAAVAGSAQAHHSVTAYDRDRTVEIRGVVQLRSPHTSLIVEVAEADTLFPHTPPTFSPGSFPRPV